MKARNILDAFAILMEDKLMEEKERKIKFGISLNRKIFDRMVDEKENKSRLIEKLLKEYYGNKNL